MNRWRLLSAVCLLGMGWVVLEATPSAPAQQPGGEHNDVLFGALILASNSPHPQPPPESILSQAGNLEKVFGYNEFRVLGERRKIVPPKPEEWLVPGRQFSLRVDTRARVPGGYALALQLVEQDRVVVEASANVRHDRPLFIRGPLVGDGQLVILLTVL